ncbi:5-hydroxytryptamine receptor 4 [Capricornis sumatraensis]|uniref:5-hydroxytryptamine receptor 4 n=1 Tax=Capricornis sumatraensis TaxID=34865 RepID=UPI0036050157
MEKAPIELEYTLKNQSSGESEKGEITNSSMESMSTEERSGYSERLINFPKVTQEPAVSPGLPSSAGQRSPGKAPAGRSPRSEVPLAPARPLPCAPGRAPAIPGFRRGLSRGGCGLGAAEPAEPPSVSLEENDARRAQVSRGWGLSAAAPGGPAPLARRPPSAGAGARTRGGGREGAGSGWERGGGGSRSSVPRRGVAVPVRPGASLPSLSRGTSPVKKPNRNSSQNSNRITHPPPKQEFCSVLRVCVSSSSKEGFKSVEKVVLLTFLSAVILMAILGNLLVMVAVCRDRQLRKIKTNYFIVSLAFADLLVSVLVMPFGAIELVQDIWIYGEMFCLVRTSLDVLLTTASIFHLCCISLDRYYAICCQPLVYRNKMTPLRIALMLGGCWVIPMFISFLPIMQGWNNIGIIDLERISKPRLGQDLHVIEKRKVNQNSNSTYCIFMVNKPYAITCSVVAFYIPFLLMVLAYYRIYVTAKEHAHQIQMLQRAGAPTEGRLQPTDQHSTHRMRTETKAAKTLCIIMGCFCLCWAPFFVTNIVDPFVDYTVPGQVWTAFLWLGYINSGLNPFLYAFLNKSFRRAFLIILCCDDERYRRPSILGQTVPCSTTTINGSTHVLRDAVECGGQWESQSHPPASSPLVAAQPSDT